MSKKSKEISDAQENDGVIASGVLNQVIIKKTLRPNGTLREQQDFSFCPTLAEQHTAHLTDLNYLIAKYKPDELAAYIAARSEARREIIGHDFSQEPSLQEAKNVIYKSKSEFDALPDELRNSFKNHLEFLKFVDNPNNADQLLKLGLITKKQIQTITAPVTQATDDAPAAKTQDAAKTASP